MMVDDYPSWLLPPRPVVEEGQIRKVTFLEHITPSEVPEGLLRFKRSKRTEFLARIAAIGLTEDEYVRERKNAAARRRREKARMSRVVKSEEERQRLLRERAVKAAETKRAQAVEKRKAERKAFHRNGGSR